MTVSFHPISSGWQYCFLNCTLTLKLERWRKPGKWWVNSYPKLKRNLMGLQSLYFIKRKVWFLLYTSYKTTANHLELLNIQVIRRKARMGEDREYRGYRFDIFQKLFFSLLTFHLNFNAIIWLRSWLYTCWSSENVLLLELNITVFWKS